jgi:hypothetical protein
MPGYFSRFPTTSYSNTQCVNILRRCRVLDKLRADPFVYYPYTLKDGQRADSIAHRYYSDELRSWLVWTSMDLVDPYYEFHISADEFNEYITTKYGSVTNAQNHILYWELDWSDSDGQLAPNEYNALPEDLKKYYNAKYGIGSGILYYYPRKEDWITTTNMIVTFDVTTNSEFTVGELAQVKDANNAVIANVEVAWSNDSVVIVQHVQGNTPGNNATLTGLTSNVVGTITGRDFTANCIPVDERVYWEPVTIWDHERSKNEYRRHIKLIDNKYQSQAETELENLLNDRQPIVRR